MGLRLAVAALAAEHQPRPAVAQREPGDQRVQRHLPRADHVGVAGLEVERRPAVVEVDPPLVDPQAAAGAEEVRLDQAHEQTVTIGRVQVDRPACRREPRREALPARAGSICARRSAIQSSARIESHSTVIAPGSPEVRVAIGERELHRFDEEVLAIGAVDAEIEPVGDAQCLQRGDPLRGRRHLEDLGAAHDGTQRLDPLALVLGEISGGHEPAGIVQALARSPPRSAPR